MKMNKEELIKKLEKRRGELLYAILEDDRVFHPEIIVRIVYELRGIINILKEIK